MTLTIETLAEAIMDAWDGDEPVKDACVTAARNIITAIEQAGYVVVPRKSEPAMCSMGYIVSEFSDYLSDEEVQSDFSLIWEAMIAAAPKIGGE